MAKSKLNTRAKAYTTTFNRAETVNKSASITANKTAKRYDYGLNNLLPNELLKAVEASVTASNCRTRLQEFIEGNGLKDVDLGKEIANPNQTYNDLFAELSDYTGLFKCPALNVKYNALGEPKFVYALPFETTRKTTEGDFYTNENLSKGSDLKKDRIFYEEFDRTESAESRIRRVHQQIIDYGFQTGDIVYLFAKKAGQKQYPIPNSWGGLEAIESDAAIDRLDRRNIKKGFRPDVVLTTVGEINDTDKDERGLTDQDHFDKSIENFTGEDAAPVLHLVADSIDQMPTVVKFDSKDVLNQTTEAENRIGRRVCRAMDVPEVLVPGFAKAGQLGNNQEMINILSLFSLSVGKDQRLITRAMESVFPEQDWTIDPLVLIDEVPEWLLAEMSSEEKRQMGGLEGSKPKEETEETTQE